MKIISIHNQAMVPVVYRYILLHQGRKRCIHTPIFSRALFLHQRIKCFQELRQALVGWGLFHPPNQNRSLKVGIQFYLCNCVYNGHALKICKCTIADKSDDDPSVTDDYSSTFSCTGSGDSGFSDSRAFLKVSPLSLSHQEPKCASDSASAYVPLNKPEVHSNYYKLLNRDNIPGI